MTSGRRSKKTRRTRSICIAAAEGARSDPGRGSRLASGTTGPISARGFEGLSDLPLFARLSRAAGEGTEPRGDEARARRVRLVGEALRPAVTTDAWRRLPAAACRRARRAQPLRLRQRAARGGDYRIAASPQARDAGRHRRARHPRSRARPPCRCRVAPLEDRDRRFGRYAIEPDAAGRLPAARPRSRRQPARAGATAGRAEAPARRRRFPAGRLPRSRPPTRTGDPAARVLPRGSPVSGPRSPTREVCTRFVDRLEACLGPLPELADGGCCTALASYSNAHRGGRAACRNRHAKPAASAFGAKRREKRRRASAMS